MRTLVDTLRGKLWGKIPVWLVVLLVTGAAFYVIHKRAAKATSDTTDTTGGDLANAAGALDSGDLNNGYPTTQNWVFVSVPGQTTSAPVTTPTGGPTPPTAGGGGGGATIPAPPKPGGVTPVKTNTLTYKVVSGDTLYGIAAKETKAGHKVAESAIYNSNKSIIESTAKAHGYKSSDSGHWIFPGEKLVIPA